MAPIVHQDVLTPHPIRERGVSAVLAELITYWPTVGVAARQLPAKLIESIDGARPWKRDRRSDAGSADQAGVRTSSQLTFHPDNSMKVDQEKSMGKERKRRSYREIFIDALTKLSNGEQKLVDNIALRQELGWDEDRYNEI